MNKKIKEYIKKATIKGYDKKTIKTLLKSEGWKEEEIEKAFFSLGSKKNKTKESLFLSLYLMGIWVLLFLVAFPLFYLFIFITMGAREGEHLLIYFSYIKESFIPFFGNFFIAHTYIYAVLFVIIFRYLSNVKTILFIFGAAIFYYIFFFIFLVNWSIKGGEEMAMYGFFLMIFGPSFLIVNLFSGVLLGKIIYKCYLHYQNFTKKTKIKVLIIIPLAIIFIFLFLSYYSYSSIKKEKELQKSIESATDVEFCKTLGEDNKNKCFYNVAILSKDHSVCDYLPPETWKFVSKYSRYNCFYNTALLKEDFSICENLLPEDEDSIKFHNSRENCYYKLSKELKNPAGCLLIDSVKGRVICYIGINPKMLTVSICNEIPEKEKKVRYNCFYKIAELNKDFSVCNNLPVKSAIIHFQESKDGCYYSLSKSLEDSTGCYLIDNDIRNKVSCLLFTSPEELNKSICDELKEYEIETKTSFMPNANHCYEKIK